MTKPILYGAAYSVYVRTARLVLTEKQVAYQLIDVDVFTPGGPPGGYLARHPFGKIPAFEHDELRLYETSAITRYVDEAFGGPPLQPKMPEARARMNQAISIHDNYVYPDLVWGIYMERVVAPRLGRNPDEQRIARLLPKAETCLAALEAIMQHRPWLAGPCLTLADLHAAPMFDLFCQASEGAAMLARHPRLMAWWSAMSARESMTETEAPTV